MSSSTGPGVRVREEDHVGVDRLDETEEVAEHGPFVSLDPPGTPALGHGAAVDTVGPGRVAGESEIDRDEVLRKRHREPRFARPGAGQEMVLGEVLLVPADVDVEALRAVICLPEDCIGHIFAGVDSPTRPLVVDGPHGHGLRAELGVERFDELPVAGRVREGQEERRRAGHAFDRAARAPEYDPVPFDRGVEDPHGQHPPAVEVVGSVRPPRWYRGGVEGPWCLMIIENSHVGAAAGSSQAADIQILDGEGI